MLLLAQMTPTVNTVIAETIRAALERLDAEGEGNPTLIGICQEIREALLAHDWTELVLDAFSAAQLAVGHAAWGADG